MNRHAGITRALIALVLAGLIEDLTLQPTNSQ